MEVAFMCLAKCGMWVPLNTINIYKRPNEACLKET